MSFAFYGSTSITQGKQVRKSSTRSSPVSPSVPRGTKKRMFKRFRFQGLDYPEKSLSDEEVERAMFSNCFEENFSTFKPSGKRGGQGQILFSEKYKTVAIKVFKPEMCTKSFAKKEYYFQTRVSNIVNGNLELENTYRVPIPYSLCFGKTCTLAMERLYPLRNTKEIQSIQCFGKNSHSLLKRGMGNLFSASVFVAWVIPHDTEYLLTAKSFSDRGTPVISMIDFGFCRDLEFSSTGIDPVTQMFLAINSSKDQILHRDWSLERGEIKTLAMRRKELESFLFFLVGVVRSGWSLSAVRKRSYLQKVLLQFYVKAIQLIKYRTLDVYPTSGEEEEAGERFVDKVMSYRRIGGSAQIPTLSLRRLLGVLDNKTFAEAERLLLPLFSSNENLILRDLVLQTTIMKGKYTHFEDLGKVVNVTDDQIIKAAGVFVDTFLVYNKKNEFFIS
jgi:hypothetical protein